MTATRKILLTLLTVGLVGSAAGVGVFSAFSSTTQSDSNRFRSGTVAISDNDGGSAIYSVANQKPGTTTSKCVKVTFTGSLDSDVKLYTPSTINASGQYVNLKITPVTYAAGSEPTFPGCGSPATEGTALFNGKLGGGSGFATKNSYATGISVTPAGQTKWNGGGNEAVFFKFDVSVDDDNNAQGADSGLHSFTWEARNQ